VNKIEQNDSKSLHTIRAVLTVLSLSAILLFIFASLVSAEPLNPTLSVSKTVTGGDLLVGGTIEYTIVISASSDPVFTTFNLTDTLPISTTYLPASFSTNTSGFTVSENNGVLTATERAINSGDAISFSYSVQVDSNVAVSTVVTNMVNIGDIGNSTVLTDTAVSTIITVTVPSTYYIQLPLLFNSIPAPTLNSITAPSGGVNEWTLSWSNIHSTLANASGYELQEATDADFTENVVTTSLGLVNSTTIDKSDSIDSTTFYYRVRVKRTNTGNDGGAWSETQSVSSVFNYYEGFDDSSNPTNWRIVRQDTDTVINELSISDVDPDYLDLRMESRFDYMIASDLTQLPLNQDYTFTARMRLEDADPRHAGGIILGANYDGTTCPVDDYSTCFTQYYRFMFIAGNLDDQMTIELKRIESHSSENNSGSGTELREVTITLPDNLTRSDWMEWSINVQTDGTMTLNVNTTQVFEVVDTEYQGNAFFGFWSSTSDTTFSNTQIDWVRVEAN